MTFLQYLLKRLDFKKLPGEHAADPLDVLAASALVKKIQVQPFPSPPRNERTLNDLY